MKDRKEKSRAPILAAGGIVLRNDRTPQFAIVQLRKVGAWGLPKGKLAGGEDAMAAARREVLEETGHRVTIHEFLGTLAYEAGGRPKVVHFWRMHAIGEPTGDLMGDVRAVHWLGLEDAIEQLSHLRERVFLEQVGPIALKFAERSARRAAFRGQPAAARIRTIGKGVPLAPADGSPVGHTDPQLEPIEQDFGRPTTYSTPLAGEVRVAAVGDVVAQRRLSARTEQAQESGVSRGLIEKTWGWLRDATMSHRPPLD